MRSRIAGSVLLATVVICTVVLCALGENPSKRYAVLIVGLGGCNAGPGGHTCSGSPCDSCFVAGPVDFFYDTILMKELLTKYYCFDSADVFVLYGNGYGHPIADSNCPRYGAGGDTLPVQENQFWGPAVYDTLRVLLHGLAYGDTERNIPKVDSNDMLVVWTFDHGCISQGHDHVYLGLGYGPSGTFRSIVDDTLAAWLRAIQCDYRAIFMQQCYSGGFINRLHGDGTVTITAGGWDYAVGADDSLPDGADLRENEVCDSMQHTASHGEFDYHFMNALRRETVVGNPIDADSNHDGWVSLYEAWDFTWKHDSKFQTVGIDSDLIDGSDLAENLSLYGRIDRGAVKLCEDTTYWSGNVTLFGDVVLPEGKVLVIKPGTTIKCDSLDNHASGTDTANVELIIKGTLLAEGTSQNPIKFTSRADPSPGQMGEDADDIWRGIRFRPGSSGTLQHCTIRRAYYAVECDSANPTIEYSSLCDNQIAGIRCVGTAAPTIAEGDSIARGYRGIICIGHSAPVIQEGVVVDTCDVGILAQGYSAPVIRDCRIKRCHTGISATAHSAPRVESGCDIFGNSEAGILLDLAANTGISIDSCKVRDNDSYGIRCEGSTGVTIFHSGVYGNAEGVVGLETADCLLGKAAPEQAGYNNIYDNDDCNVRNSTTNGDTLKAENCWWGSSSPDTSKICGPVDYQPYLTSQIDLALPSMRGGAVPPTGRMADLGRVYPSPVERYTVISYAVKSPGAHVKMVIANVLGQTVSTLVDKWKAPGEYTVSWDRRNTAGVAVESGIYFCVLEVDNTTTEAAKLVVVGSSKPR